MGKKTILKVISCHEEFFGCKASWNDMESGHGKGPFNPIKGWAKCKTDPAVKNEIIFRLLSFMNGRNNILVSSNLYICLSKIMKFRIYFLRLKTVCQNLKSTIGTMKVHAVFLSKTEYDLGPRHFLLLQ